MAKKKAVKGAKKKPVVSVVPAKTQPQDIEKDPYAIRFEMPNANTGKNDLIGELVLTNKGMVFKGELDRSAEMFFNKAIELYKGYLAKQARIGQLEAELSRLR